MSIAVSITNSFLRWINIFGDIHTRYTHINPNTTTTTTAITVVWTENWWKQKQTKFSLFFIEISAEQQLTPWATTIYNISALMDLLWQADKYIITGYMGKSVYVYDAFRFCCSPIFPEFISLFLCNHIITITSSKHGTHCRFRLILSSLSFSFSRFKSNFWSWQIEEEVSNHKRLYIHGKNIRV